LPRRTFLHLAAAAAALPVASGIVLAQAYPSRPVNRAYFVSRPRAVLRPCPLYPRTVLQNSIVLGARVRGGIFAVPLARLQMREYGLSASVMKLDATPTRSKRRPPVAAHGREA